MDDMTRMEKAVANAAMLRANLGWALKETNVVVELMSLEAEILQLQASQEELALERQFNDMLRRDKPTAPKATELLLVQQLSTKLIQLAHAQQALRDTASIRENMGISA